MGAWSLAQFFNLDETPMEQIHAGVHPQQPIKQKSLLLKKLSQVSTTRCQQMFQGYLHKTFKIALVLFEHIPEIPINSSSYFKLGFTVILPWGLNGLACMVDFCFGHGIVGRDQSFTSMDLVSWRWLDRMDDSVGSRRLKQDLDRFG